MDFYLTPLYFFGLIAVGAYAIRRFNEPSFPNNEALPSTTEPLRYLFLKREYRRARLTYVVASLILYTALIWPGPSIVPKLGIVGLKEADTDTWALIVALVLVGVMPNISVKWLGLVEENLRRVIHSRFLVPDGTIRMIESLKYAHYEPRASLLSSLSESRRASLHRDLQAPQNTLSHRWARATMLMESLRQLGTGAPHPLDSKAFEPFAKDFDAIEERYRFLEQQVDALDDLRASGEQQASLGRSAETLLRRIYAYINWGIRHKANTEGEVTQTLEDLGFAVPTIGNRRIFDIVFPAAALIFIITMFFWTTVDGITHLRVGGVDFTDSILRNMNAAFQASLMYGGAVLIALVLRDKLIQRMEWRGTSIKGYVSIAVWAGFTTWAVITLTSAGFELRKSGEFRPRVGQLGARAGVRGAVRDHRRGDVPADDGADGRTLAPGRHCRELPACPPDPRLRAYGKPPQAASRGCLVRLGARHRRRNGADDSARPDGQIRPLAKRTALGNRAFGGLGGRRLRSGDRRHGAAGVSLQPDAALRRQRGTHARRSFEECRADPRIARGRRAVAVQPSPRPQRHHAGGGGPYGGLLDQGARPS